MQTYISIKVRPKCTWYFVACLWPTLLEFLPAQGFEDLFAENTHLTNICQAAILIVQEELF